MSRPSWSLSFLGVVAFALGAVSAQAEPLNAPPAGFVAIFNGRDLEGWRGATTEDPRIWQNLAPEQKAEKLKTQLEDIHKHWTVENGELVNDGHGLYLTTMKDYGDFELRMEYKTVAKADSGIYLRGIPQVQIWDYTKEGGKWDRNADKGSGGLFNNPRGMVEPSPSEKTKWTPAMSICRNLLIYRPVRSSLAPSLSRLPSSASFATPRWRRSTAIGATRS